MKMRTKHHTWKALLLACIFLFFATSASIAQKDAPVPSDLDAIGPAFEVASIRPANRDDGRHGYRWFRVCGLDYLLKRSDI